MRGALVPNASMPNNKRPSARVAPPANTVRSRAGLRVELH